MSPTANSSTPLPEIIEKEKAAYRDALPPPESKWPAGVQLIYRQAVSRLFEEGIAPNDILTSAGLSNNNVYTRFRHEVGRGIKEFVVANRMRLAKRLLLKHEEIPVAEIAYAVGYSSPSGFCTTFKRHEKCTPTAFRKREEK